MVSKDPKKEEKAKYWQALKEGTPKDYAWETLTKEEREEVQKQDRW